MDIGVTLLDFGCSTASAWLASAEVRKRSNAIGAGPDGDGKHFSYRPGLLV